MKDGDMWQAYGTLVSIQFAIFFVFTLNSAAHINKAVYDRAREAIGPYQKNALGAPDPSFILQLPDDVYTGSNLYAFQKFFDGPFQFDVFYDSGSVKQKLTCKPPLIAHNMDI